MNVGTLVFTVSDIYLITGNGESGSPFAPSPLIQRTGLLNYNALTVNGSLVYFMSTDNQVIELNPHAGIGLVGQPVSDLLNEFSPYTCYLTWHARGYQDQALFVADGNTGWYKMLVAIPPEQGQPWCPKADITGGVGCVQSIETSPGDINLLLAPPPGMVGPILYRDYTTYTDNGETYPAFFTFGSIVLAHPGQVAAIEFITTDSAKFQGAVPLTIGVLIGEISGDFEQLTQYVNDPPQLVASETLNSQRFYLLQSEESIECRHMQIRVNWIAQNFADEIESLSPFGGFSQES